MEKSNLEPASSPPNLEHLFILVQSLEKSIAQQKQEFVEQKQQLESKIARLEEALKEKANLVPETQPLTKEVTSRRRMLKKLGGAAAGMAAATTLMVTTNTQSAQAAGGLLFQGNPADPNVVAATTKIIAGAAPSSYSLTSILELSNTNNSGVVDGIQSSSAQGVGLIGQSNLTTKAGVIGTNGNLTPSGLASVASADIGGVSGGSDAGSGRGVTGYVTGNVAAVGVFGKATGSGGIGVVGIGTSTSGLGGSFATGVGSTRGQLLLQPSSTAVGSLTGNTIGEMYVDSVGRFYIYENSAGTGAAWKLFGTSNPSGVIRLLTKPGRFVDTRSFVKLNDTAGAYTDGVERTYNFLTMTGFGGVTIPANATGLVGNITCVANSAGFLQVSPNTLDHLNDPSTLNFSAGAGTANAFIATLNAGKLKVFCRLYTTIATSADIIIDIAGYLL